MPTIATGIQTKRKDCYAPSEKVQLTLRSNGEESVQVIDPYGSMVQAGFDAPTVDPSLLVSVGGSLAASTWYSYRYCYASSNYPYVQNAVTTGNGELWPRSNPSDFASATTTVPNKTITVTVTKTTRSDVDKIVVYRTTGHSTQAAAEADAEAGQMFWIGTLTNNGIAGTTSLVDNGLTDSGEQLESDNFTAPMGWFCEFTGTEWVVVGNPEFIAPVTLNGTNTVIQSSDFMWFPGRNSQKVTFDDITSGGADGRGTYFFKWLDGVTASLYTDSALTVPATVPYSGATFIHVQGPQSSLYRSKPFNPFSWGFTQQIVADDGTATNIPQEWVLEMGGGSTTAVAVAGVPRKLKVDFENPQKCIAYDLEVIDDIDAFAKSAQDIDLSGSVTAHFSQFHGFLGEEPVLFGLDTCNGNILVFNGTRHIIVSDSFGPDFLTSLNRSDDVFRDFHGQYDPETELNVIWVRLYDTEVRLNMAIWIHGPTQEVGFTDDFDVLSSCTILDSDTNERFLLGGTTGGNIGQLFDPDTNVNWTREIPWKNNSLITGTTLTTGKYVLLVEMNYVSFPSKYTQAVTTGVAVDGTFIVDGDPTCQVGDSIQLYDLGENVSVTRIVLSIDGSEITVDAYDGVDPPSGNVIMLVQFDRVIDQWVTIQNPTGTDEWFACIESWTQATQSAFSFTLSEYIHRGSTEIQVNEGSTAPWPDNSRIVFGCIPCYYRAYFNLGTPTENKRAIELWATAGSVAEEEQESPFSFADTLSGRYYVEFNEESDSDQTFLLSPTIQQNQTVRSFSWVNKPSIPSTSLAQFGMELGEIGTEAFTLYDWTIKIETN